MSLALCINREDTFTNLDWMEGTVTLKNSSPETIEHVTVKIEGISTSTAIEQPVQQGERRDARPRTVNEIHKLLYVTVIVFPDRAIREQKSSAGGLTLQAGTHEWPFRVRLPMKNECQQSSGFSLDSVQLTSRGLTQASVPQGHISEVLPPSLSTIADSNIRYFVKATVVRKALLKRNYRQVKPFVFCPLEPARPQSSNSLLMFIRKRGDLIMNNSNEQLSGLFSSLFKSTPKRPSSLTAVFETRLPNPPILVPTDTIPLEFLILRESNINIPIHVRFVKVSLMIKTALLAKQCVRNVQFVQPLYESPALQIVVPPGQREFKLPSNSLSRISIPNTIPPTFKCCNISRTYQMIFEIGLSTGPADPITSIQTIADIQVYSGFLAPFQDSNTTMRPGPGGSSSNDAHIYGGEELPTYNDAVGNDSGQPTASSRGRFTVEQGYFQGSQGWDDEKN